ncbi:hypothetical protein PINS_up003051 [Pythium insidiosum]|nr:hypothetical protein PINS_up003051 [Pythium insidiosum]
MLQDRMRQLNVLEAQYAHLQRKAKAKHALYSTTIERLEALTTELFETKQSLHAQCEISDDLRSKAEQAQSLENELHRLRSENLKLNDVIATLTSRPLESWDEQMQRKTLLIAKLEEEKNDLESELQSVKKDVDVQVKANAALRTRVASLSADLDEQCRQAEKCRVEAEKDRLEREVSELKLRFFERGDANDKVLMEAVGRALKAIKLGEQTLPQTTQETKRSHVFLLRERHRRTKSVEGIRQ